MEGKFIDQPNPITSGCRNQKGDCPWLKTQWQECPQTQHLTELPRKCGLKQGQESKQKRLTKHLKEKGIKQKQGIEKVKCNKQNGKKWLD